MAAVLPGTVAITGASGLIGSVLSKRLRAAGCTVVPVSRRPVSGGIAWDPTPGILEGHRLNGIEAVVHLAGESIAAGRWNRRRKEMIHESRVAGTSLLARTIADLPDPPRTLISMSAVGIYGDHGDDVVDETTPAANDFLGSVGTAWERSADPARDAGIRVVHPRMGVVLAAEGGALPRMLPPFRFGLGAALGSGRQWMPWISIRDAVSGLIHLLADRRLVGPVNLVSPAPVTNREFTRTLARILHRPALFAVPAPVLRLMFGEMAEALLLTSQRVAPARLIASGFRFTQPELADALAALLSRTGDGQ